MPEQLALFDVPQIRLTTRPDDEQPDPWFALGAAVAHVRRLAKTHAIGIQETHEDEAFGCYRGHDDTFGIVVPFLVDQRAVAVALHELGHVLNDHVAACSKRCSKHHRDDGIRCVACELEAWTWARANVYRGEWLREHQHALWRGLESYRWLATRSERRLIEALLAGRVLTEVRQ